MNELIKDDLKNIYSNFQDNDGLFSFCSFMVCPVGVHVNYQNGNVIGFSIENKINRIKKSASVKFDEDDLVLEMSGKRYDIGNIESSNFVNENYTGI